MEKGLKRLLCALLTLTLLLAAAWAGADGDDSWNCPNCGKSGNTGNFCAYCGAVRPDEETWTCLSCGQSGNKDNFCAHCGAARPDTSASFSWTVDEGLEQIPGEDNRVKICLSRVEASSYIVNKQNPSRWLPDNAVDGDESTCWQFSAKKGLKGKSWLALEIGSSRDVDEIWFKNGFWAYNDKGGDQYGINARLKGVQVAFRYSGESSYRDDVQLTLKDESRNGWQRFSLGHHTGVAAVRVAVLSSYKGSHYANDVCLSEVMLVQQASSSIAKAAQAEKEATVYASNPAVSGASLKMKLATRSGPTTEYDEPGTFFINDWEEQTVKVLGKSWDGSIWWVLVDFSNHGKASYRVWTGLKRVDVDIDKLKEIKAIGQGFVGPTSQTYRGPGGKYAKANIRIHNWIEVRIYDRENGYVEIGFRDGKKAFRLWVPEAAVSQQ